MFAVLKTGGKQYKVAKNDTFAVEKLSAEPGETVQFDEVLMLGGDEKVTIGNPFVTGAAVQAEVVDQFRGPKTISFKKRRRKHSSQRRKGHRQSLTMIRVTDILTSGAQKSGGQAAGGGKSAAKAPKAAAERKEPAASAGAAAGTPPANLLSEAKGTPDDLKRLSGVGPKMEKALNDAGVYHFSQIADWTEAEVAYMDEALSARGRIERDNWTSQAAEFAAAEE